MSKGIIKSSISNVSAVLLTILLIVAMLPMTIFAAGQVQRSGDLTTFMKNMPSAKAVVDPIDMGKALQEGNYELTSIDGGEFVVSGIRVVSKNSYSKGTHSIGGYQLLYKNVVTLSDGTTADLLLEESNIQIDCKNDDGKFGYLKGNPEGFMIGTGTGFSSRTIADTKVTVVKDGKPVDTTMFLFVKDMDVGTVAADNREQVDIVSGLRSDVFLTGTNNRVENKGLSFYSDGKNINDPTTFNTGFAALMDNSFKTKTYTNNGNTGFVYTFADKDTNVGTVNETKSIVSKVNAEIIGDYLDGGAITTTTKQGETVSVSTDNEAKSHKSMLYVPHGNEVEFNITVKEGYLLDKVLVDGKEVTPTKKADGTYTYKIPELDKEHTVQASYRKPEVTYISDANGSVDKSSEVVSVKGNPTGSTDTPNAGYEFTNWTADKDVKLTDGTTVKAGSPLTDAQIKQIVVTEDIKLTANHTAIVYYVAYMVEGDDTYGLPQSSIVRDHTEYHYNDKVTVQNELTTTWTTSNGKADGVPGTWTFSGWDKDDFNITEDTTISGSWTFTPDTYKVSYTTDGRGKVDRVDEDGKDYKSNPTGSTPIPNEGCTFTNWTADVPVTLTDGTVIPAGSPITQDQVTQIVITSNIKLQANFETNAYDVTYKVAGDAKYGSPTDATAAPDAKEYLHGDEVVVAGPLTTAWTTSDGTEGGIPGTWKFSGWDTGDFTITEDTTINGSWTFTPDPLYTVTYVTDGNGTVTTPDEEVYENRNPKGTNQNPKDGYKFVGYTADKDVTLTDGTKIPAGTLLTEDQVKEIVVIEDITLTASYDKKPSVSPTTDGNGSVADSTRVVETGDATNLVMWFVLMATAAGLLGFVGFCTAKNRR